MIITSHSVEKFRNIGSVSFVPHPEMNIVYGENGQGKTNIIESIWLMTGFSASARGRISTSSRAVSSRRG